MATQVPLAEPAARAVARLPAGHRALVAAFMLVGIASGCVGAAGFDTVRDVAQAYAIRHFAAFPMAGPQFANALHLGPLWFYVLALPLFVHESWLSMALFVPALASLQFPLAYAAGRRLGDARLGLLWCALLALPGWGSFLLVGFAHTSVVPACVMLVLYALVRLAQDRHPAWMVAAAGALSLAINAHPLTAAFAPLVLAVTLYAVRDPAVLVRWGAAAIPVACLPFAPVVVGHLRAPAALLGQSGEYVESMVHAANLANVPALLHGIAVRGPRLVADAFASALPGGAGAVFGLTLAIEAIALAGLAFAWRDRRTLTAIALATVALVTLAIAWVRPQTPFYLVFTLLPPLAGLAALGIAALSARVPAVAPATVGLLLALHVAMVAGIGITIASGHVAIPVASRFDVKADDPAPPVGEPWFPAYAVDASGRLQCAAERPVIVHGTYAFLEDMYSGLDHRLACGGRGARPIFVGLLGATPAGALHLVGMAKPLWAALGWQPRTVLGGLGVAPAARVLSPLAGFPVPDGSVYPPHAIDRTRSLALHIDAAVPRANALVVSLPYGLWMPPPAIAITANGVPQAPLARDAVSAVYACRSCADGDVNWRIDIESVAPDRVDVVTLAPPG